MCLHHFLSPCSTALPNHSFLLSPGHGLLPQQPHVTHFVPSSALRSSLPCSHSAEAQKHSSYSAERQRHPEESGHAHLETRSFSCIWWETAGTFSGTGKGQGDRCLACSVAVTFPERDPWDLLVGTLVSSESTRWSSCTLFHQRLGPGLGWVGYQLGARLPALPRAPLAAAPRDGQHQRRGDAGSRRCLSPASSVVS